MEGITFSAWRDGTYIELTELIDLLRPVLPTLTWRLSIEEAISTSERAAAKFLVDDVEMTQAQLLDATTEVQIIDGRVIGRDADSRADAIVIQAVDSTWWDVYASDTHVLRTLQAAFPNAQQIPI